MNAAERLHWRTLMHECRVNVSVLLAPLAAAKSRLPCISHPVAPLSALRGRLLPIPTEIARAMDGGAAGRPKQSARVAPGTRETETEGGRKEKGGTGRGCYILLKRSALKIFTSHLRDTADARDLRSFVSPLAASACNA